MAPPLGRRWTVPGVALLSTLAAAAASEVWVAGKLARQVEATTLDWRVRSVPPRPREESPVVLVLFDSASVRGWPYLVPFPRRVLAGVIDAVAAGKPRAIGVDVYLDRRYPALEALDGGDHLLRDAIRRAGNVVLATGTEATPEGRQVMPVDPYFAGVAAGVGSADTPTPYETVRDATLSVRAGERRLPGFALALWALARGVDADSLLRAAEREGRLGVAGLPRRLAEVPRDAAVHTIPLLFVGPPSRPDDPEAPGAFVAYGASEVAAMDPVVAEFLFRDRIVLVGSGFHAEERFRSPFYDVRDGHGRIAGWTYGVEVHATALENLLSGRYPRPLPGWLARLGILGLALGVALASFRRGPLSGAIIGSGLLVAAIGAAFAAFGWWSVQIPLVEPALALLFSLLGSASYLSIVEGREKREIRRAFARYVPPAVVSALVADPRRLVLGGEKRHVSVLFSDLEGFTRLAEAVEPEALVHLLNHYLDEMTEVVLDEGGTLDKYIGDAVMALFGAPAALPDHALHACRTALRMHRRLAEMNEEWAGRPALRLRVGVNTGTPVVGNIGGRERFDYTALGDAVNVAARLEPACKTYGVGVMISAETRAAAGDGVVARELDVLRVYGRAEAAVVFELVALAGEPLGPKAEVLERFAEGLAAYRRRDFALARVFFAAALEADPEDGPARLYLARCDDLIENPPPAEWSFEVEQLAK